MNQTPEKKDWHPADIKAALQKAGTSMQQLSLRNGLCGHAVRVALDRPYPKAEKIIADALGLKPEDIWPERWAARRRNAARLPDPRTIRRNAKRARRATEGESA
jgi:Ner family transcriptional regulator